MLVYLANWVQIWRPDSLGGMFGHTWSLAIEEQFYLLFPLLLFLLFRLRLRRYGLALALFAGALAVVGVAHHRAGTVEAHDRRSRSSTGTPRSPGARCRARSVPLPRVEPVVLRHRHARRRLAHRLRGRGGLPAARAPADRTRSFVSRRRRSRGARVRRSWPRHRATRRSHVGLGARLGAVRARGVRGAHGARCRARRRGHRWRGCSRSRRSCGSGAAPYAIYLFHLVLFQLFRPGTRTCRVAGVLVSRGRARRGRAVVALRRVAVHARPPPIRARPYPLTRGAVRGTPQAISGSSAGEDVVDDVDQLVNFERLGEVGGRAGGEQSLYLARGGVCTDHDNRCRCRCGIVAKLLKYLVAGDVRNKNNGCFCKAVCKIIPCGDTGHVK